jgi:GNAT superfamily N-acetyltransferase
MLHIHRMALGDLALGVRLKNQAGWNQTEADWRRMIDLQPDGCFVAELDGQPVGTTTTCIFDSIGWIAMVLVEESARGRGIGTRLMEHALTYLDRSGVRTARLDATPLGRPVYEKLGFVAEYELARWEGTRARLESGENVISANVEQLEAVVAIDCQVTGTNRRRLLERIYHERPEAIRLLIAGRTVTGYLATRIGSRAVQIGPVVALDEEAGRALLDSAMACSAGRHMFLDIPADNTPATRWAEAQGFRVQRTFTRMRRGEPVYDQPTHIWASFGPEKG